MSRHPITGGGSPTTVSFGSLVSCTTLCTFSSLVSFKTFSHLPPVDQDLTAVKIPSRKLLGFVSSSVSESKIPVHFRCQSPQLSQALLFYHCQCEGLKHFGD